MAEYLLVEAIGYAARSDDGPLAPLNFQGRSTGPHDVRIDILYCGVCHTDLHFVRHDWCGTIYPLVPGHKIVGRVVKPGRAVTGSSGELIQHLFNDDSHVSTWSTGHRIPAVLSSRGLAGRLFPSIHWIRYSMSGKLLMKLEELST